jgi:hypothetical protein
MFLGDHIMSSCVESLPLSSVPQSDFESGMYAPTAHTSSLALKSVHISAGAFFIDLINTSFYWIFDRVYWIFKHSLRFEIVVFIWLMWECQ